MGERIKETIVRRIIVRRDRYKVTVEHDGLKRFHEQNPGLGELDAFLYEQLNKPSEKRMRFVPYNNFECSFSWQEEKTN